MLGMLPRQKTNVEFHKIDYEVYSVIVFNKVVER